MAETITSAELFGTLAPGPHTQEPLEEAPKNTFSSEELGIQKAAPLWVKVADFFTGHLPYDEEAKPEVQKTDTGYKVNVPESAAMPFLQDPVTAAAFGLVAGAQAAKPLAGKALVAGREALGWLTGGASEAPQLAAKGLKGLAKVAETKETGKRLEALRAAGKDVPITVEDLAKGAEVSSLSPVKNIVTTEELMKPVEPKAIEELAKPVEPVVETVIPGSKSILASQAGSVDPNLISLGGQKFITQDVIPTARGAAVAVAQGARDILGAFSPTSLGGGAKETAGILRANLGEMAQKGDQTAFALKKAKGLFEELPPEANHAFMNNVETGTVPADAVLTPIASTLRTILDTRREQVQALGTGKLQEFYENYFPHIWKDPEAASDLFRTWFSKTPMEGSKAFLKGRTVPTIQDGLNWRVVGEDGKMLESFKTEKEAMQLAQDSGGIVKPPLELVSNNPIDLTLLKTREIDKYIMAQKTIQEMKDQGLAQFVKATQRAPEGWTKINDKIATVYAPPSIASKAGVTILGNYYAPENAARIVNNYLSPGLRGSALFRGYLDTANILNQAQLGMSAFHLGFTTLDATVSKVALGLNQLSHGDVLPALKSLAMAPVNLAGGAENIYRGSKVLKEWYAPGSQGAEIGKIVDALRQAGGRVQMDRFYATNYAQKMMDAFKTGNIPGGIIRAPLAMVEKLAKPIMEFVVPRQKLGVFADLAHYELGRLEKAGASSQDIRATMQKIWDSVDNRMGQLVYDNLFWNKTIKDLGMASVRSLGWNLGTFRELGGSGVDLVREGVKAVKGNKPELTYRMAYAMALPMVVGTLGALTTYAYTGKGPQELRDYFFPNTGKKDAEGNDIRIALPSYMKDLYHYYENAGQTIKNKLHPAISSIAMMLDNHDYYGTEIRNADDPIMKQAQDELRFMTKQVLPFSVQGIMKNVEQGKKGIDIGLPTIGVTPAPKYIGRSDIQNEIFNLSRVRNPPGEKTKFMWDQAQAKHGIVDSWKQGDQGLFQERVQKAIEDGYIKDSKKELKQYLRNAVLPGDIKSFRNLPESDQMKLMKKMTPEEIQKFAWYAKKNVREQMGDLSPNTSEFVAAFQRGEFNKPEYKAGYAHIQEGE